MISWRYATQADVLAYYGELPDQTIRAIIVLLDDVPSGIVGLDLRTDRAIAFSEQKPELEPHMKSMTVLRAIKRAQRMFRESPVPVIVVNTSNPPLLERLGFTEIEPGVHLCHF